MSHQNLGLKPSRVILLLCFLLFSSGCVTQQASNRRTPLSGAQVSLDEARRTQSDPSMALGHYLDAAYSALRLVSSTSGDEATEYRPTSVSDSPSEIAKQPQLAPNRLDFSVRSGRLLSSVFRLQRWTDDPRSAAGSYPDSRFRQTRRSVQLPDSPATFIVPFKMSVFPLSASSRTMVTCASRESLVRRETAEMSCLLFSDQYVRIVYRPKSESCCTSGLLSIRTTSDLRNPKPRRWTVSECGV